MVLRFEGSVTVRCVDRLMKGCRRVLLGNLMLLALLASCGALAAAQVTGTLPAGQILPQVGVHAAQSAATVAQPKRGCAVSIALH